MMLLSGYTLGFFFPKQSVDRREKLRPSREGTKPAISGEEPALRRPADDAEREEVPASYYFYRYF